MSSRRQAEGAQGTLQPVCMRMLRRRTLGHARTWVACEVSMRARAHPRHQRAEAPPSRAHRQRLGNSGMAARENLEHDVEADMEGHGWGHVPTIRGAK